MSPLTLLGFVVGDGVRRHSFQAARHPSPCADMDNLFLVDATLHGRTLPPYVTADAVDGRVRRHSSPVMTNSGGRRRSIVSTDSSRLRGVAGSSTTALRSPFGPRRSTDDFRPLQAHFRKRSSAEQSLMSFRLGSNDDDLVEEEEEVEEEAEEERLEEDDESKVNSDGCRDDGATGVPPPPMTTTTDPGDTEDPASSVTPLSAGTSPATTTSASATAGVMGGASETTEKKRASLKRNHTDDSEVIHTAGGPKVRIPKLQRPESVSLVINNGRPLQWVVWSRHVERKTDEDWVKRSMTLDVDGTGCRGGLKKTCCDCVKK